MAEDCKPILCPRDLELIRCVAGCAIQGLAGSFDPVDYYKFDEENTVKDNVYGDADPAFFEAVALQAIVETSPDEEQLTAFGARNKGLEDNDIDDPDVILYFSTPALDEAGIQFDLDNRDEFELTVHRRRRRYSVIGTHYEKGLGGVELTTTIYLLEKGPV